MAQSQNQGVFHIIIRAVSGDDSAITEMLWHYYDRLVMLIDPLVPDSLRGQIEAEDILLSGQVNGRRGGRKHELQPRGVSMLTRRAIKNFRSVMGNESRYFSIK